MYTLTTLERGQIEAGTSVLAIGDDNTTREQLLDALAEGDDGVLLVTTGDASADVQALLDRDVPAGSIGIVDASGAGVTPDGVAEAASVDGPDSLSQLGIESSDRLDRLGHRFDRVRVGLCSIDGLLAASPLASVFRFVHVFAGRTGTDGALFVATLDSEVDDETRRTLAALFDLVVEIE